MRNDGRENHQARILKLTPDFTMYAEGSVLVETGKTKVICNASVEDKVPSFLKGKEQGWVSSEYGMLPRATSTRTMREAKNGQQSGRSQEIQRLIGRSLRTVVDMKLLGERTIWIDCDVIQADGGTRTASITGGYVAMILAMRSIHENGGFAKGFPVTKQVAAISLGILEGETLLDLDYFEDRNADVDMNLIMSNDGNIIEIQGTAEKKAFSRKQLDELLVMAEEGIRFHFSEQLSVLGGKLF